MESVNRESNVILSSLSKKELVDLFTRINDQPLEFRRRLNIPNNISFGNEIEINGIPLDRAVLITELFNDVAALYDEDQQGYPYIKRFTFEASARKRNYLGENKNNRLILLSEMVYPRLQVVFGGADSFREPLEIDVEEFIGTNSYKAKGKRITTFTVESIAELEPIRFPEEKEPGEETDDEPIIEDPDYGKSDSDIIDEITGQMKLF